MRTMFRNIHHIAIIGTDYNKTKEFYVNKLGFEVISEHNRPEKKDIIINVKQGDLNLEIFIKENAPIRPKIPNPEHTGLRHLAFRVENVEKTLKKFDELGIFHEELRFDDFDNKKMAFFFDPDGLPLEVHE
jgi:glyoxylase family protein